MATFEESLRAELSAITGLTNKIYPLTAPPGTSAPYVAYESSGLMEDKVFEGFLESGTTDVTLHIVASSFASMKSYAALVKTEIKSWLGNQMSSGPTIRNITFGESSPELYESEVNLYRKIIDFTVHY